MLAKIQLLLNQYIVYVIGGLVALILLLIIIMLINTVKMNRLKKRFNQFMSKEDIDFEGLLVKYTSKVDALVESDKETRQLVEEMKAISGDCIQKVGIVRYQAIPNIGADLSYTVALLNKENSGVVFNGIYGRDGCYTYAKPIQNGQSTYNLSDEEAEAIHKAILVK